MSRYRYSCPNRDNNPTCQHCSKRGILLMPEESELHPCPDNSQIMLESMAYTSGVTVVAGQKMTKEEIVADRRKRSKTHFEKEVMPYLPKDEQRGLMGKGYRNK